MTIWTCKCVKLDHRQVDGHIKYYVLRKKVSLFRPSALPLLLSPLSYPHRLTMFSLRWAFFSSSGFFTYRSDRSSRGPSASSGVKALIFTTRLAKRLDLPRENSINSDDIYKVPIGRIYDVIGVYISVDPSSCGGSRICMLSGVASSGLNQAEVRDNNTTV